LKLSHVLKKGSRGAFYGRHSTKRQDMDTQKHSVEMLAQKYGCTIIEEYPDRNISATHTKMDSRKELNRLLRDAARQEFDFVAVYKDDRLARNPIEHLVLRQKFREYEIPVVISSSESLYDSGELVPTLVRDGISKFESDNTRDRTHDTAVYKTQCGEWIGGRTPFGYNYHKETGLFEKKESEIIIVRKIYDLYKQGYGFQTIANTLNNEEKIGVPWRKEKIKSIILNPFYAGYMNMNIRNRKTVKERSDWVLGKSDKIPPEISIEEWEYCYDMYDKKRTRKINPKHFKTSFLLKDLLFCKDCNKPLIAKNQKSKSNNGKEYGESIYYCKICDIRIVDKDIHKYVFYLLLNGVLTKDFHREPKTLYNELFESFTADQAKLQGEIEELENELGKLAIERNKIDEEISKLIKKGEAEKEFIQVILSYRNNSDKEEEKIKQLIQRTKEKIDYIGLVLKDFSIWKDLYKQSIEGNNLNLPDTSLRRMALHLIEKIEVKRNMGSKTNMNAEGKKHSGTLKTAVHLYDIFITAKMNMEQENYLDIEINI